MAVTPKLTRSNKDRTARATLAVACIAVAACLLVSAYKEHAPLDHVVIAGGKGIGYGGDGGKATLAGFNEPQGLCLDRDGKLYIADSGNHAIRMVDRKGIVTTAAGTGKKGFSGDGGPAAKARLANPYGVFALPDGSGFFIVDTANNRIRKVDSNGVISTVAGNGHPEFSGDRGSATSAGLSQPEDVAAGVDGTIYIADTGNNRIRRVDRNGVITTWAGTSRAKASNAGADALSFSIDRPRGLCVARTGELYFTERKGLRRIDRNRRITIVASNLDDMDDPGKIAIGGNGDLYFVDHFKLCTVRSGNVSTLFEQGGIMWYPPQRGDGSKVTMIAPSGVGYDPSRGVFESDEWISQVVLFSGPRIR